MSVGGVSTATVSFSPPGRSSRGQWESVGRSMAPVAAGDYILFNNTAPVGPFCILNVIDGSTLTIQPSEQFCRH